MSIASYGSDVLFYMCIRHGCSDDITADHVTSYFAGRASSSGRYRMQT